MLPSDKNAPLASSPLIAGAPAPETAPVLAPWQVEAVALTVEDALALLPRLAGEMVRPGIFIAHDLKFWSHALNFAASLVARQQFLPGIVGESEHRACWSPVFTGPDQEYLAHLAQAMPHACRAVVTDEETAMAGSFAARSLLEAYISVIVDHLVRSSQPASSLRPVLNSLHERWLQALKSSDDAIKGDAGELQSLAGQVSDWQRSARILEEAPWRLCFRLQEPAGENDDAWEISYLLQAREDPSLLVPAGLVWRGRGVRAAKLLAKGSGVKEYLLRALGQAATLSPLVEASLGETTPDGSVVDTQGAFDFLESQVPLLEQAGFGVQLPGWWMRKAKPRITARAKVTSPKMQAEGSLTLNRVVQFDWELALGGEKLTLQELEELASLKTPLVQLRGQWVQLNAEEIGRALDFWKKNARGVASVHGLVQMTLGSSQADGIPVEEVQADGWIGELLAQLQGTAAFEEMPVAQGFAGQLRPYQQRGYSWLCFLQRWGLGACLADDMGLGKTPTTLAFLQREWENTPPDERRPVLLVCPTSVIANWQREAARFTPELPVLVHHGLGRGKGAAFKKQAKQQAVVLSSYALLHRDYEILNQVQWSGVVLDEAQNIKNSETKQAKAARSLDVAWRVALTGTPVENNVGDLWSLMEFLNPGFLGGHTQFKRQFFAPIQTGSDPEAAVRLQKLTRPFVLRRLKTDKAIITDLPEKMEMKVFCPLTKEQASLYAAVVKDAELQLKEADGIARRGLILATLTKLKQVCNHPAQFLGDNSAINGRSGKLARLMEMLEEVLGVGERALIFTQFREMGEIIQRHFQENFGREAIFLHGGVRKKSRDGMVERFQSEKDAPPVFILSLKAGGVGLNLTNANHVFHFDRWWNPAVENQATDRAFRIGQTRNVQVHKFLCAGTLEEKIDDMIESKQKVAEQIVGTGESWLTELSTNELKELFALRADAVSE